MSVKLAVPAADRAIPWTGRAKFLEIGREWHLNGSLRECIAAYSDLSPERRGMAMIISDALVPACRGLPAVCKLAPRDMDCLLEAFHAEARGRDARVKNDAVAEIEPAQLPV